MSNVQEISQKVQEQTLDVVREAQNATVDAVTTWAESVNKFAVAAARFRQGHRGSGSRRDHQAVPGCRRRHRLHFDFAQQILDSQREFARRIVAATKPAAE